MMADRTSALFLLLSTGLIWALYVVNVDSPARAPIAIAYLLVAPGLAAINLLDLGQAWVVAVLAIALSFGIMTVVCTVLLVTNLGPPGRALAIVGTITVSATVLRLAIVSRQQMPRVSELSHTERRECGK